MNEPNFWESFFSFLFELDTLLAIIGAAAWIPALRINKQEKEEKEEIKNRAIEMSLFDFLLIDNTSKETYPGNYYNGSLLLIAANLYIPDKSFFAKTCTIRIDFCNGDSQHGYIVDGTFRVLNGRDSKELNIPKEYNFNLHREIIHDKDNIRILAIAIPNREVQNMGNIDAIEFTFKDKHNEKHVVIASKDYPYINNSNFLDDFRKNTVIFSSNN